MGGMLTLDGTHGEGGGQILRTALSLSIILTRPFRLVNIRANRPRPGLRPQHLAAVRAAAAITDAVVAGDTLDSSIIEFVPSHPARAGNYLFDVEQAAERGSAGSVTLILQTLIVPLAMAGGPSSVMVRGGTHVEWSPPFDFLADAYLPFLRRIGFKVDARLNRVGWYPRGGGEVVCQIDGAERDSLSLPPLEAIARSPLRRISGQALGTNVPAHVPQRMLQRAQSRLGELGVPLAIAIGSAIGPGSGTGIFLLADYEDMPACFSGFGRRGKPAEAVAEEAVAALLAHHRSTAAVELHLADQLLLPLSFTRGSSRFTAALSSRHLLTNAWTIRQFGAASVTIEENGLCGVGIQPCQGGRGMAR